VCHISVACSRQSAHEVAGPGDPGKSLPRALSRKYLGEDPPPEPDELGRVIVRVIPERVNAFSA
jgi:hypothetical protein